MQKKNKRKERDEPAPQPADSLAADAARKRVADAEAPIRPAPATAPAPETPAVPSRAVTESEIAGSAAAVAAEKADPQDSGHSILGSALVVGLMTLVSRLTGLLRFRVMGKFFGASYVADAFNMAFIFPNLTRRLFGEGLLTSVFVPVFSDRLAKDQKEAANRTASVLLIRLSYWLSIGCVVCIGASMGVRFGLGSKLSAETILTFKLFEALLPYCVLINVAAVLMAILNSLNHFWMPAFAPVLLNVAVIAACYLGLQHFGTIPEQQIWVVAIAVLIGGALQLVVQLPPALARGFKFSFTLDTADPGYREVMDSFKPVVLMVAVFQLNVMLDNLIARWFIKSDGPVTFMNMGTSVYQLAWSIIALAIGVAALPMLSRLWALDKKAEFHSTLTTALRYAVFASLPCAVGAMLLSEDVVRFLYGTGKFLANDGQPGGGPIQRTGSVVFYSCLGLVFYSVNSILVRALYAMKDMKTPTRTLFYSALLNVGLNFFFILAAPRIAESLQASLTKWVTATEPALRPGTPRTVIEFAKAAFFSDLYNIAGKVASLRESGIILAGTISTAWQTWALAKAVRERMGTRAEPAVTGDFLLNVVGSVAASAILGLYVYRYFLTKDRDAETLYAFGAGVLAFAVPAIFAGREYVGKQFKALRSKLKLQPDDPIPLADIPESLRLQNAIFTSLGATMIMGLLVWAVRDSLPPEGRTLVQVMQRALAPVAAGMLVYSIASSALMSHEYEELMGLVKAKLSRKKK